MKTGRSLQELARQLEQDKNDREDFLVPTGRLDFDAGTNALTVDGHDAYNLLEHTHGQIGSWANIPKAYYERMRADAPDLLNENVNHWLHSSRAKRTLRTMRGDARAFLSDRFRPLDNWEVASNSLEALAQADCTIASCEVTERRFYLKAISRKIEHPLAVGDVAQAGLVISNSEVGCGSLRVEPLIFRLRCSNGMISPDAAFKRNHIGSALKGAGEGAFELFTDETRRESDRVVWMQIRDIVKATMSGEGFKQICDRFAAAKAVELEGSPFDAVEKLAKKESLTEGDREGILASLLSDRPNSTNLFGLVNAVTDYSKQVDDYEKATDFERLGGQLLAAV